MVQTEGKLPITLAQFEEASVKYFEHYVRFGQWREEVGEIALEKRIATSFMGHTRRLYGSERDIVKQSYNVPGQAGAAEIMNTVTAEIWKGRKAYSDYANLSVQIHDDLRFECREDRVEDLIAYVIPIMEQTFSIYSTERKFTAGVEIGSSWDMEEIPRERVDKILAKGQRSKE